MDLLIRFNHLLNKGLACIAGFSLVVMMTLTVGEMVMRMFGHPMAGMVETIGWLAAVTTAFALGYTQLFHGHVAIDLLVHRFPPRVRAVIDALIYLTSTILFGIVTWYVFAHAGVLRESGSLSETMKVIVYPWVYLVSFGCLGLTMALFADFLQSCIRSWRPTSSN